jgi:hypothetical protein
LQDVFQPHTVIIYSIGFKEKEREARTWTEARSRFLRSNVQDGQYVRP